MGIIFKDEQHSPHIGNITHDVYRVHWLVFFFHLYYKIFPLSLSFCPLQPYYSTRVNAADIDNRVKQLDQTTGQQQEGKGEGEGEKSKAGFWEEFDVRFDLTSVMFTVTVTVMLLSVV